MRLGCRRRVVALAQGALALLIATVLVAPGAAGAASPSGYGQQNPMTFSTSDQSIWGPGAGSTSTNSFAIVPLQSWAGSASGGSVDSACLFGLCTYWGAQGSASANANFGVQGYTEISNGAAYVTYPMLASIQVQPRNGNYINVDTSWATSNAPNNTSGTTCYTTSNPSTGPSMCAYGMEGQFWAAWTMNFGFNVQGQLCVGGCVSGGFGAQMGFTNASLIPQNVISTSTKVIPLGAILNTIFDCGTINQEDPELPPPCPAQTFQGTAGFPAVNSFNVSTSSIGANANQQQVTASGNQTFLTLSINAAALLCHYSGCPVPLTGQIGTSPFSISGTLLFLGPQFSLTENQSLQFTPEPNVTLSLGQSFPYTVLDSSGNTVSTGSRETVTFPVGDTLRLYAPQQGSSPHVTEIYQMNNQFTVNSNLQAALGLEGYLLELGLGPITLGPVYTFSNGVTNSIKFPLIPFTPSGTWQLGGFNTNQSSFYLDLTPPAIAANVPQPNAYGWYNTPVTVTFSCNDGTTGSGVASCPGAYTFLADAQHSAANQSTTVSAVDNAGNTSTHTVSGINIDTIAPTITGAPTVAANQYDWYNKPVTVAFSCSDSIDGVATCAPVVLTQQGANQSATGTGVDKAGNVAQYTVSGINIDFTPPTITFTNNQGTYTIADMVNIGCSASDSVDGVISTSAAGVVTRSPNNPAPQSLGCPSIQGPAYNFNLGQNAFSVSSTDMAGNTGTGTTSFTTLVTSPSLLTVTNEFTQKAGVTRQIAQQLAGDIVDNNTLQFIHDVAKLEGNGLIDVHQATLLMEFGTNLLSQGK